MTLKMEDFEEKIMTARASIYKQAPFFARLCMYMKPIFTNKVPITAITKDGTWLINPESAKNWNIQDLKFCMGHELLHLYTHCFERSPEHVDMQLWNMANDIVINHMLASETDGLNIPLPRKEIVEPLYHGYEEYHGKTTEEIYHLLKKKQAEQPKSKWICDSAERCTHDKSDSNSDKSKEGSGSPFEGESNPFEGKNSDEIKEEWKARFQREISNGKQAGNIPGFMSDFLTSLTEPTYNWRRILRMAISSSIKKKFTWTRPNRRTASVAYTPATESIMPKAVCAIDTSGSMTDSMINQCLSEFSGILKLSGGVGTLMLHDTDVYSVSDVNKKALSNVRIQRGGTDFRPIFEQIKERDIKPRILVMFTDCEGTFPNEKPPYPVVVARPEGTYANPPKWAKVIDIKLS